MSLEQLKDRLFIRSFLYSYIENSYKTIKYFSAVFLPKVLQKIPQFCHSFVWDQIKQGGSESSHRSMPLEFVETILYSLFNALLG